MTTPDETIAELRLVLHDLLGELVRRRFISAADLRQLIAGLPCDVSRDSLRGGYISMLLDAVPGEFLRPN